MSTAPKTACNGRTLEVRLIRACFIEKELSFDKHMPHRFVVFSMVDHGACVCIWSVVLKRSPRDKEPFLGVGTNRRDSPNSCVSLLTVTCLCLGGYLELRICVVVDGNG